MDQTVKTGFKKKKTLMLIGENICIAVAIGIELPVLEKVRELLGFHGLIETTYWNDSPARKFEDVKEVLLSARKYFSNSKSSMEIAEGVEAKS